MAFWQLVATVIVISVSVAILGRRFEDRRDRPEFTQKDFRDRRKRHKTKASHM